LQFNAIQVFSELLSTPKMGGEFLSRTGNRQVHSLILQQAAGQWHLTAARNRSQLQQTLHNQVLSQVFKARALAISGMLRSIRLPLVG
jgi:hypothetical protein